jgi:ABC-type spermidine/putrescine transport system permease subunit II
MPVLIILAILVGPLTAVIVFSVSIARRRARRFGYASTRAYLRAIPRSDAETRDAVDLALQGL